MPTPRKKARPRALQEVETKPTSTRSAVRLGIVLAALTAMLIVVLSVLPLLQPGAPTSFSFSVDVPQFEVQQEQTDVGTFGRFVIPSDVSATREAGKAELPVLTERVAIPCGASNVAVTAAGGDVLRATPENPIFPVPKSVPKKLEDGTTIVEPVNDPDEAFYATEEFYPAHTASLTETTSLRGVCYATVTLNPYRYNPGQRVLLQSSRLNVTVTWTNPATAAVTPNTLGQAFDGVLGALNVRNLPEDLGKAVTASTEQQEVTTDGTAQYVTNLLVNQEPVPPRTDYLIVASNDLFDADSPALRQLADFRSQATYGGYNVTVVRMGDVLTTTFPDEEQGQTYSNDEKLKLFLRYAYQNWNGAALPPSFVTLIGDGDGTANATIPIHTSLNGEFGSSYPVAADFWYTTNLDDSYPQYLEDNAGDNQIGSIAIGRLPVKTETELQRVVDKIVQFEAVAPSQPGSWRSQTGMYSGFKSDEWSLYHLEVDDFFNTLKTGALTPHSVESFTRYRKNVGDGKDDASRIQYHNNIMSDMQAGRVFLVNASHGSINTFSDGTAYQSIFAISDIPNLNNADRPPIVFALACSTAAFGTTYTDSLGEAFLKNSDDGAVGYIGASEVVSVFSHTVMTKAVQQALNVQKLRLGAAVLAGKNAETYVGLRLSYNYLGDPALNVGAVLQMSTSNPDLTGSLNSYTMAGRQVTVHAIVQNTGFTNASSVPVDVYNGDPRTNGTRLTVSSTIVPTVEADATLSVDVAFTMPSDWNKSTSVNLYLSVDQDRTITELNENNNVAGPLRFVFTNLAETIVANGSSPSASADTVVYTDGRDGFVDLLGFDRTTGTERRITDDITGQFTPSTSDTSIVWEDTRSSASDIYSYDLVTNTERRITNDIFEQLQPAVSGSTVVWEDWRNRHADIYSDNLTTGVERRLTANTSDQTAPAIAGSTVVWEDWRNGNADIYSLDITTGVEQRITTDSSDQGQPTVSDRGIAWADHRNGSYDIYYYDFATGTERRITTDSTDQTQPVIAGGRLAWIDSRNGNPDVYVLENGADGLPGTTDDGQQRRLTDNPSIRYRQSITITGTTAYYSGNDGSNRVYRVELDSQLVPTATNRDGVLVGKNTPLTDATSDLGAKWVRVNHDLDGSVTPDLTTAKAYLDAGVNVLLSVSNRNPSNIYDPRNEFGTYPGAGFPFPDTPEGRAQYQEDVQNVLTQLQPYLVSGRTIFVQAENEIVDATIFTTSSYWRGTLDEYLRLLDAFAEAVRSVDPSFTAVLSSFTNNSLENVTGPTSDPQYAASYALLTTMLAASDDYDAVDLHFYGCPEDIAEKVAWVKEHLPSGKRWVSTENGGPMLNYCGYPVQGRYVDWNNPDELIAFETEQTSQVTRRLQACARSGGSICLWFSLVDQTGSGDAFGHLGLITRDEIPRMKPAFSAFQTYEAGQTNTRPTLQSIGSKNVVAGTTLTFTVQGSDVDGNPLTYRASSVPAGATFANQTFSWTPAAEQAGASTVRFTASDGALDASEDVTMTVRANRAPVLSTIGSKSVFSSDTLSFVVTATDADGDSLFYSATNLPIGATFANQTFMWTPTTGQVGAHLVRFSVTDGITTISEDVTITVSVNSAPVLSLPGDQGVVAGATLSFSVSASDAEANSITLTATGLQSGARFTDGQNGTAQFFWTPTGDQVGTSMVTITASDGRSASSGTVRMTVTTAQSTNSNTNVSINENVNRGQANANTNQSNPPPDDTVPPQPLPDPQDQPIPEPSDDTTNAAPVITPVSQQVALVNIPFSLVVSAIDKENDPVVFTATNVPTGATFGDLNNGSGVLSWTPASGQVGSYTVTVSASDGRQVTSADIGIDVLVAGTGGAFPATKSFVAFSSRLLGGFNVTSGNVWGDVRDEIAVGTGEGMTPEVRVFSNDGTLRARFFPFPKRLRGGVQLASCDLDADGKDELLVASGPGFAPFVRQYTLASAPRHLRTIWTLDGKSRNGVRVACADVDGDGRAEIIAAASRGSGQVTVHRTEGRRMASFFPFGKQFRGGITLATVDDDGDGKAEILVGKESGGGTVRLFTGRGKRLRTFTAFPNVQESGVALAAADVDGNGVVRIIAAATGDQARAVVRIFTADGSRRLREFSAYAASYRGGMRLAAGDVDADGAADIITIPAERGMALVNFFDAQGKVLTSE